MVNVEGGLKDFNETPVYAHKNMYSIHKAQSQFSIELNYVTLQPLQPPTHLYS